MKLAGTVIPMQNSILQKIKGNCASDMSFMHGRRFKVGWGPQNSMLLLNTLDNCQNLIQNGSCFNIFRSKTH